MKHVAQAAGVSVMTVSLAMRHDPSIPATTRERVLGIAMRLGYRRIGLVVSRHEDGRVEHNWLSSILLVQHENAGTERSFPLFFEEKIERRALLAWLRRERPEVVLTTEQNVPSMLARAGGQGMPCVGFAHMHLTPDLTGCSGIDQNNEQVGAAAVYLVVEQLHGNSFGLPKNPKTVLIEGRWVPGTTAPGPRGVAAAS